jgi:hypothetical protein
VLDSVFPVYFELCRAKVGYTLVFEIDGQRVQWIDLIPVTGERICDTVCLQLAYKTARG